MSYCLHGKQEIPNIHLDPGWSRNVLRLMFKLRNVGRAEIDSESMLEMKPTPEYNNKKAIMNHNFHLYF